MRRMKIGHCTPRTALTLFAANLVWLQRVKPRPLHWIHVLLAISGRRPPQPPPPVHLELPVLPERGVIVWNHCKAERIHPRLSVTMLTPDPWATPISKFTARSWVASQLLRLESSTCSGGIVVIFQEWKKFLSVLVLCPGSGSTAGFFFFKYMFLQS